MKSARNYTREKNTEPLETVFTIMLKMHIRTEREFNKRVINVRKHLVYVTRIVVVNCAHVQNKK